MQLLTELLYERDSYLQEFEAVVIEISDNGVVLDRTAFHPLSGGVANDTGFIKHGNDEYRVVNVVKSEDERILHVVEPEPGFKAGCKVTGVIDWERRYRLMKLHTADHILAAVLYKEYSALVTGGHIDPEKAKSDFSLEKGGKELFKQAIEEVNQIIAKGIDVKIYFLPREEALKIPGIVKLAGRMPPDVKILRIVEIPGVDIQADGGPHVSNTAEIGQIKLLKVENKGRGKKRVYFTLA